MRWFRYHQKVRLTCEECGQTKNLEHFKNRLNRGHPAHRVCLICRRKLDPAERAYDDQLRLDTKNNAWKKQIEQAERALARAKAERDSHYARPDAR